MPVITIEMYPKPTNEPQANVGPIVNELPKSFEGIQTDVSAEVAKAQETGRSSVDPHKKGA